MFSPQLFSKQKTFLLAYGSDDVHFVVGTRLRTRRTLTATRPTNSNATENVYARGRRFLLQLARTLARHLQWHPV